LEKDQFHEGPRLLEGHAMGVEPAEAVLAVGLAHVHE
jgi:hypothetical protein